MRPLPRRLRGHLGAVLFEVLKELVRQDRPHTAGSSDPLERLVPYGVVAALSEYGTMSQKELSVLLRVNAGDLVAVLDELEIAGLLTRTVDPDDRRRHALEVTAAGRAAEKARAEAITCFEDRAFAVLKKKERASILADLGRVLEHLRETAPEVRAPSDRTWSRALAKRKG